MKRRLFAAIRIVISISFIGLLFYLRRDDLSQTVKVIRALDPALFLLSCAATILSIVMLGMRFSVLLSAQGLMLKTSEAVNLTFIGYFFNNFLPTAIGGDVVKAYYAYKKTDNKLNSFLSVFIDRLIGFFGLFCLAGVSLIFCYAYIKNRSLIWITLAILSALTFIFALFFNKRLARIFSPLARLAEFLNVRERIEKVYNNVNAFKDKRGVLAQAFLISIVAQITSFSVIYLLTKGMGSFISIKMVLLFMPLVVIISMFPSINGLGVRESAIYFLFGPYLGYKNAFALSLLWLFMLLLGGIIGGIIYLLGGAKYKAKNLIEREEA